MSQLDRALQVACDAARDAGKVILSYYGNPELVADIKPDQSPVTVADKAADALILDRLRTAFPEDGTLTEESADDGTRLGKSRLWIVDPLDGTRDFLAQTGDFSVHIGLCVEGRPVLGVVYQPVRQALYHAVRGGGAFLDSNGTSTQIRTSRRRDPGELRVGISRLNPDEGLGKCLAASGLAPRAVAMGASVKHMALARGDLDAVLNLSPAEQEWDTCAPEVILAEAGCTVSDGDGKPMQYNQKDLYRRRGSVWSNGLCHPFMLRVIAPCLPEYPVV
ncbi:MAG TPA: 3'(2'),5'-bisphosphate nucleotidase CysQ [Polyangia bacterium]|nr:3'(2'),5'-bisphosphate nucleotidase CysQ [Polyangia bacterium]